MAEYYQISIEGHLDEGWAAWFDGMTIRNEVNGSAMLCGELEDQAALHGVLVKIRDLGMPLLGLQRIDESRDGVDG